MLLGGSWVVISGDLSPLIWVINTVTLLITPFIATHEPPSRGIFGIQPLRGEDLSLRSLHTRPRKTSPDSPRQLLSLGAVEYLSINTTLNHNKHQEELQPGAKPNGKARVCKLQAYDSIF